MDIFSFNILEEVDRISIQNYDIDVYISNSAIGDSGSVSDIDIARIKEVFDTNVFCNLMGIQSALKPMIDIKKKGRIVILSSLVGRIPMPFLSPYCASKFALECFGMCLKQELKQLKGVSIDVCLIEPGAYATGFNQENNNKKYQWMDTNSYFSSQVEEIRKKERKIWNFLEQKPYTSIISQYVRAVEDVHPKFRYTAPWWQAFGIQLARIFGE